MLAPTPTARLEARQLLGPLDRASTSTTSCPPITLHSGGVLVLGPGSTTTLASPATYTDGRACVVPDPFYASTWVFIYVLACCTIIAWIFFILLLTTQRALHPGSASASTRWIPGGGLTTAIAGRTPLGGLGSKPWLQKVAVFLVAIGLTVASVDTFRVAGINNGHEIVNAADIRDSVSGTLEVRILRVISGVFIWLAQVQTLMRLFPRRKEKLIIKWFGFTLILCDLVFTCLNNFMPSLRFHSSPRNYQDAIPALSYLFQLAISLLYLAWVSYYILTKKRYAFFIPDQLNMLIIAILALISIAIPVAFFVADISVPKVAGWGDFFRWVGSAAASIIVWEWVDRIEVVERDEKKDGILGREVFDEDELPTSEDHSSTGGHRRGGRSASRDSRADRQTRLRSIYPIGGLIRNFARKRKTAHSGDPNARNEKIIKKGSESSASGSSDMRSGLDDRRAPSPVSRTETTSADSTVYTVHYHPITITPPIRRPSQHDAAPHTTTDPDPQAPSRREVTFASSPTRAAVPHQPGRAKLPHAKFTPTSVPGWTMASNAFKRRKRSPPIEIKQALSLNAVAAQDDQEASQSRINIRSRLAQLKPASGDATTSEGISQDTRHQQPTVIPAPPRGQTWSPGIARHSPVGNLQNIPVASRLSINPALLRRTSGVGQAPAGALDSSRGLVQVDSEPSPPSGHSPVICPTASGDLLPAARPTSTIEDASNAEAPPEAQSADDTEALDDVPTTGAEVRHNAEPQLPPTFGDGRSNNG